MASFSKPSAYSSAYSDQIGSALGNIVNRADFSYNPLQDANYQALAKMYDYNGQKAQTDVLGQAAALNGGYGSSYAMTAASQARNDYNQQLAALIPDLEQNAYQRYADNFNMNLSALGALQDADQSAYSRYRDKVGDYQWQQEYSLSKKRAARSGGGGSGGGGYSSSYAANDSGMRDLWNAAGNKVSVPKQKILRTGNKSANSGKTSTVKYKDTSTGKTYKKYKNAKAAGMAAK